MFERQSNRSLSAMVSWFYASVISWLCSNIIPAHLEPNDSYKCCSQATVASVHMVNRLESETAAERVWMNERLGDAWEFGLEDAASML